MACMLPTACTSTVMRAEHGSRPSLDQLKPEEDKTHSMQLSVSGQVAHGLAFFFMLTVA